MKPRTGLFCLLVLGITSLAVAQSGPEMGKTVVEGKHCTICHKEGGKAMPLEEVADGKTDAFLKEAITDPKKAISPHTLMPPYKLTDQEVQAVIEYLRSISKK